MPLMRILPMFWRQKMQKICCRILVRCLSLGRIPNCRIKLLTGARCGPNDKEGDLALLRSAKPDFLGINYYRTDTVAANPLDGVGIGKMNTTGEKGSETESGVPGLFKK